MAEYEKHLKIRSFVAVLIFIGFILFGYILNTDFTPLSELEEPRRNIQRSCLGNPIILPYVFIGIPSIFLLGLIDIIALAVSKKITIKKVLINFIVMACAFLSIFILPF